MNPTNLFITFLQEIVMRLKSKSPKFFAILQWIFGAIAAVTGIPAFLVTMGVELHGMLFTLESKAVAVCTALMWIIAKLPVENKTVTVTSDGKVLKQTNDDKLPFTKQEEVKAATDKGLQGTASLAEVINATVK